VVTDDCPISPELMGGNIRVLQAVEQNSDKKEQHLEDDTPQKDRLALGQFGSPVALHGL